MSPNLPPKALIAEDEPLLANSLRRELAALWPELATRVASDGLQAVDQALQWLPDVLFFDIRMPGQSGLDAAQEITERWPAEHRLPLLVFITAFDQFAVQAFEYAAVDFIVKPVNSARLQKTIERIRGADRLQSVDRVLQLPQPPATDAHLGLAPIDPDQATLDALRQLLSVRPDWNRAATRLQTIQASVGQQIVVVPLSEVLCFEAADKYVRVLTGSQLPARELLIRTPIKVLSRQLDPEQFWQIHRSTLVRVSAIETVFREESGKLSLQLRGCKEKFAVSRLYAPLFKAM